MRLIYADALAAELYKHHVHDDEELEPLIYLADAEKVIADAPTVDAIPVEWLMKVLAEANEFPIVERETIVAIPYLVKRWQKEQEAQDGRV